MPILMSDRMPTLFQEMEFRKADRIERAANEISRRAYVGDEDYDTVRDEVAQQFRLSSKEEAIAAKLARPIPGVDEAPY